MRFIAKVDGTWRYVQKSFNKINGFWRQVRNIQCKIDGQWSGVIMPIEITEFYSSPAQGLILGNYLTLTFNWTGGLAPYNFNSSYSTDGGQTWQISRNGYSDTPGGSLQELPTVAGNYLYRITVVDQNGDSATRQLSNVIEVTNTGVVAIISNTQQQVNVNTSFSWLGDASGGSSDYSFSWSFSNGASGNTQNVTLTSPANETVWTATLTVTDNQSNDQASTTKSIQVVIPDNPIYVTLVKTSPSGSIAPVSTVLRYSATASGGTKPYTYNYEVFLDGVYYGESGPVSSSVIDYRTDVPGIFSFMCTVTDSLGNTGQSAITDTFRVTNEGVAVPIVTIINSTNIYTQPSLNSPVADQAIQGYVYTYSNIVNNQGYDWYQLTGYIFNNQRYYYASGIYYYIPDGYWLSRGTWVS